MKSFRHSYEKREMGPDRSEKEQTDENLPEGRLRRERAIPKHTHKENSEYVWEYFCIIKLWPLRMSVCVCVWVIRAGCCYSMCKCQHSTVHSPIRSGLTLYPRLRIHVCLSYTHSYFYIVSHIVMGGRSGWDGMEERTESHVYAFELHFGR